MQMMRVNCKAEAIKNAQMMFEMCLIMKVLIILQFSLVGKEM